MSTDAFELFFTLLTLVANVTVLVLVGGRLTVALAPASGSARWAESLLAAVGANALALALGVALISMAGSLYFSEVADFTPCTLCWYQRIAMYPLVVLLGVAVARRDRSVRAYVWPLAALGAAVALYHYLLEWFPRLDAGACSLSVPCELVWFRRAGFVTLSYMALSGFLLIAALMATLGARPSEEVG